MTPYGIVYSDNIISLGESRKQWLKKEKIVNKAEFFKGYLLIILLLAAANALIFAFSKDANLSDTVFSFAVEALFSLILFFISLFKIKENSYTQICYNDKEKKQIVLKENSAVFTAPFRQSEYFYEEIESVVETENTITFFFDSKYSFPVYVSKNNVEKGEAGTFANILYQKIGSRYVTSGGAVK